MDSRIGRKIADAQRDARTKRAHLNVDEALSVGQTEYSRPLEASQLWIADRKLTAMRDVAQDTRFEDCGNLELLLTVGASQDNFGRLGFSTRQWRASALEFSQPCPPRRRKAEAAN